MLLKGTFISLWIGMCLLWLIPGVVVAQEEEETPSASDEKIDSVVGDETQKKYERKSAFGLSDLGLESRDVALPVSYCETVGKKKVCNDIGTWHYTINQALENASSKELYDWMITQRFDKVLIDPGKAVIITAKEVVEVPGESIPGFRYETGSYDEFKVRVEEFLGQQLAPMLEKLLGAALESRYQELPDRERETFMTTKAKELGIPTQFIDKLMNSAYVFAVYLPRIKGQVTVNKNDKTVLVNGKPTTVTVYDTDIDTPLLPAILIYKYNADSTEFDFYSEITGKSGGGSGETKEYPSMPGNSTTEGHFNDSFVMANKAAGINLNLQLKKDDNFALFFTADEVDGNEIKADVGVLEDVRVDAPMQVFRMVDGKKEHLGYARAREVCENCDERGLSTFSLIKGDVELKDGLREHPWTGFLIGLHGGMESYSVDEFAGSAGKGGGMFGLAKLSTNLDLGYVVNSSILSELWWYINFGLGAGGDGVINGTPIYYSANMGFARRFHLGSSGFFFAPQIGGGYRGIAESGDIASTEGSLGIASITIDGGAQLGYLFSPNVELILNAGWGLPLSSSATFTDDNDNETEYDVTMKGGLQAFLGLTFHSEVVGFFARFYSKPSTICREKAAKKKLEEQKKAAEENAPQSKEGATPLEGENPAQQPE